VRVLTSDEGDMLKHVPRELREELEQALTFATIVVAFHQELPVAFCYAGWETETLWDVSIDTLASWRRQGYGTAAARELMTIMRSRGKRAVWAALDTNRPSLGVAVNLGFDAVAKLHVLTRASGL
jgi:GNAT superfamily N-acetyltransferase